MLKDILKNYRIILASGSPRRQQFFKDLNIPFEVRLKPIDEIFDDSLAHSQITDYLAQLKALPFKDELQTNDVLITSDTIVWHNNKALGKPKDNDEAFAMLKSLSNATHEVITSVNFKTKTTQKTVNNTTKVTFKALTDDEIWYYIKNFSPLDKAGSYGIQDWIGQIAVTHIEGSYFNVMGLPTHLVYQTLEQLDLNP
ncbi:Maf-like protein [Aurantibacter sp.]|uniref:Maf-like protein n=1 Tax=Aurantibacter sp. TaxID=2807103 RepID=UPI0035C7EA15